jgi:hypothetical protein
MKPLGMFRSIRLLLQAHGAKLPLQNQSRQIPAAANSQFGNSQPVSEIGFSRVRFLEGMAF